MAFDILQHFQLRFEVSLMDDLDEIAEHISPELVSGVGLVYDGRNIVFELFYELY